MALILLIPVVSFQKLLQKLQMKRTLINLIFITMGNSLKGGGFYGPEEKRRYCPCCNRAITRVAQETELA